MDFIRFRAMVAPAIIQVFFWIFAIASIIVGALIVTGSVGGLVGRFLENNGGFYIGLVILVLGPIAARIVAELMIVFFRLYETMLSIDERLSVAGQTEAVPHAHSEPYREPAEPDPDPDHAPQADTTPDDEPFVGTPEPKPESRIVH